MSPDRGALPAHAAQLPPADPADAPPGSMEASLAAQRRWRSSEIFGKSHEVEIQHGDAVYRLRQTALGKLILTK